MGPTVPELIRSQFGLHVHVGLHGLQLARGFHGSIELGHANGLQEGRVVGGVLGNALEGCCVAAVVRLAQPIAGFLPGHVQQQLGVVEGFRLEVGAEVAVADDRRPPPRLGRLFADADVAEAGAEVEEGDHLPGDQDRRALLHGYLDFLVRKCSLHLLVDALRDGHGAGVSLLCLVVGFRLLEGSALILLRNPQRPSVRRAHLDPDVVSRELDDRKAQEEVASLENGRGPALQRRVSCLVDLLMVQVAACGEGRQLFDDGLHAPGGGEVFLRLEGVAQDVATGAGHLADDLQVHAGPPLPQHLDVVLPHHRVVFVPPRGQAALPAAGKLLLGRPEASARLGGVRKAEAAGSEREPAAVRAAPVFHQPCQLRVHLALVWVDLLGLQPPAWGLGADELVAELLRARRHELVAGLFVGPVRVLGFPLA